MENGAGEFPRFRDGDVRVHLSPTIIYKLHSQVLKRSSSFFDAELSHSGAQLTAKARRDGFARYRFELGTRGGSDTNELQQFVTILPALGLGKAN
jgi:hypothetical protein